MFVCFLCYSYVFFPNFYIVSNAFKLRFLVVLTFLNRRVGKVLKGVPALGLLISLSQMSKSRCNDHSSGIGKD